MLAEEWREYHNLVLAGVGLLDAVDVVSSLLVAHKEDVAAAWLAGQVTHGALSVVNHEVRRVYPLDLGGGDVGVDGNLLRFCFSFLNF